MEWNPIMHRTYTCLINEFPNSHRGSKIQHHYRGWEWHCPNIVIENNQYCFAISYIRYIFILLKIIVHLIKIHKQQRSYKHVKTLNGFWLIVVKITQKLIFKRQFFTVWACFAIVDDGRLMSLWYTVPVIETWLLLAVLKVPIGGDGSNIQNLPFKKRL